MALRTSPLVSTPAIPPAMITISEALISRPSSPFFSTVKPIANCIYTRLIRPRATTPAPQKYVYPDPIPEFAEAETKKFREHLLKKLYMEKETFGNDLDSVIEVCAEMFGEFLYGEYGGPGTLLVEPFTDMLVALKEKKLRGAAMASRASLLWAQNYLDQDWEIWNSKLHK